MLYVQSLMIGRVIEHIYPIQVCLKHDFFFNDTATTEIYTLSLHDALPISPARPPSSRTCTCPNGRALRWDKCKDRKSTRLNSSHDQISYAVFCLKTINNAINAWNHPDTNDTYACMCSFGCEYHKKRTKCRL